MDCRTDTADSLSWITCRCGDHVDRASASPSDKNRGHFTSGRGHYPPIEPPPTSPHPGEEPRVRMRRPEPISCIRRTGCGVATPARLLSGGTMRKGQAKGSATCDEWS